MINHRISYEIIVYILFNDAIFQKKNNNNILSSHYLINHCLYSTNYDMKQHSNSLIKMKISKRTILKFLDMYMVWHKMISSLPDDQHAL